jgi:hypothetical protein
VVGALEGTIVIAMALLAATEVLGPKDPLLVGSRAVAVFQRARGEEAPHHPATGAALPAVPRS